MLLFSGNAALIAEQNLKIMSRKLSGLFTVLLLLALALGCDKEDIEFESFDCEDLGVEIQFVMPDSCLRPIITGGKEPYTYRWSDDTVDSTFKQPIYGGTYSVTVTDAMGCTAEASLEAANASDCQLFVNMQNYQDLGDGAIYTINARSDAPPVTYTWSNGETGNSISITEAGTYVASITDANGCLIGSMTTINNGPNGLCRFGVRLYHGADDVLRVSFRSGGLVSPFTYLWSDGSTERQLNAPVPGNTYSVTVTNGDGCPTAATISL